MSLPSDLKPLYLQWLQELIDSLNPKQEQLCLTYEKARRNLAEHEGVFYYPKDLKKVKGIGATIMKRLESKLVAHCQEINIPPPESVDLNISQTRSAKRSVTALRTASTQGSNGSRLNSMQDGSPKKKKRKSYIPKKRSGGYAILLGLLEARAGSAGLSKDETIEYAKKYCDHSLTANFATKETYGAWTSINSLKKHNLISDEGRPKKYCLTDEGIELAKTLKAADSIVFPYDSDNVGNSDNYTADADEKTANLSDLYDSKSYLQEHQGMAHSQDSFIVNETFTKNDPELATRAHTVAVSTPLSDPYSRGPWKRRFGGTRYELWSTGSFEVYPIIDHREVKSKVDRDFFAQEFISKGIKTEVRQLALGDILWVAKNKITGKQCVLNTIIERKRLDDLASSIRDNRFMEQKNRLEKTGCENKYYVIEESASSSIVTGMAEALKTAMWIILIYYRFSVIRTSNSAETVDKLHALHTVIERQYKKKDLIVIYPNSIWTQDDYVAILEQFRREFERKSRNIECCHSFQCFQEILGKNELRTIGELTIHILMLIKGVSLEKAITIQSEYPTLSHILAAYKDCKSPFEAKMLMFNKFGEAPGTKRITRALSEKISDVFAI